MTSFADFAAIHGLLVQRPLEDGRIHRVPTEEKPRRRNGTYRFLGDWGWVCNFNRDGEAIVWKPERADTRVRPTRQADVGALLAMERAERARAAESFLGTPAEHRERIAALPADEKSWRALWSGYCNFYGTALPAEVTDRTGVISSTSEIVEELRAGWDTEPLATGAVTLLATAVDAPEKLFTTRPDRAAALSVGQPLTLHFPPERLHRFDSATGARL